MAHVSKQRLSVPEGICIKRLKDKNESFGRDKTAGVDRVQRMWDDFERNRTEHFCAVDINIMNIKQAGKCGCLEFPRSAAFFLYLPQKAAGALKSAGGGRARAGLLR